VLSRLPFFAGAGDVLAWVMLFHGFFPCRHLYHWFCSRARQNSDENQKSEGTEIFFIDLI